MVKPSAQRKPVALIMVQNLPVPFDRRVWQECKALCGAGWKVHVICPATSDFPQARTVLDGVHVYRYRPGKEARRSGYYIVEYGLALWSFFWIAARIRLRTTVNVVHICNPPDLLFLPALPLKALGAALIYDHHDACPELMLAKGSAPSSLSYRLTRLAERLTYKVADVSIETNDSYRRIAVTRGRMSPSDVFVVRSAPEVGRFDGARGDDKWRAGKKHLVGYVGVMGIQDGLDYLLDVAEIVTIKMGRTDVRFVCVGAGPELDRLRKRVRELRLSEIVELTGRLPDSDLASILATADVCVNPDVANAMNSISTMNKIMEYMALGKPIVQFDMAEGKFSAANASLYARANDADDFARNLLRLLDDPKLRASMGASGKERLSRHLSWERQIPLLLAAYERALAVREL